MSGPDVSGPPAVADAGPDDRTAALRRVIGAGTRGIEIGPWRNPVAPKASGYDTLVIDIDDRDGLVRRAERRGFDAASVARIEEVDVVGDASRLGDLLAAAGVAGRFDWIVSVHAFEHLPDPLRFLRDCEGLLVDGGAAAMIVPDKRYCFDRFQPAATFAGIFEAWRRGTDHPHEHAWAAFRQQSLAATRGEGKGGAALLWGADRADPGPFTMRDPRAIRERLETLLDRDAVPAFDGHRFRFTPAVFAAVLFDLRAAGLTALECEEVRGLPGGEFLAVLRNAAADPLPADEVRVRRAALYRRVEDEAAEVSDAYRRLAVELAAARAELARLRRPARSPSRPGPASDAAG